MADTTVNTQPTNPMFDPNLASKGVANQLANTDSVGNPFNMGTIHIKTKNAEGKEEVTDLSLDVLSPAEIKNVISELVKANALTKSKGEEIVGQTFSQANNPTIPVSAEEQTGTHTMVANKWFDSNPLVAMSVAFAAMWKTGQMQKILEKNIELKEKQISFSMSQDSAKLQIELGDLRAQDLRFNRCRICRSCPSYAESWRKHGWSFRNGVHAIIGRGWPIAKRNGIGTIRSTTSCCRSIEND